MSITAEKKAERRNYEDRVRRAREIGTYEIYRTRITKWVQVDGLMHWEIGLKLAIPENQVSYICHVLEIKSGAKRNRFSVRARVTEWTADLVVQRLEELKTVRAIRAYHDSHPTGWDRGW